MSELTADTLKAIFETFRKPNATEPVSNEKLENETFDTIIKVMGNYGEFLFSSCAKIRPICKIDNEVLFSEKTLQSFLKLIRKQNESRKYIEGFSYFKDTFASQLNEALLHYEQKSLHEAAGHAYPEALIKFFIVEVKKGHIEIEDDSKKSLEKVWSDYQISCGKYRLELMNQPEFVNNCKALPQKLKNIMLSYFNRAEIIHAWVGCDPTVFYTIIDGMADRPKKLYNEDYEYALREFEQRKTVESELLDASLYFIKYFEDKFSMDAIHFEISELSLAFNLYKTNEKEGDSSESVQSENVEVRWLAELLKDNANPESLNDCYEQCADLESLSDATVVLLNSYGLKNKLQNKVLLKKCHAIYLKHSGQNLTKEGTVTLATADDFSTVVIGYKDLVDLTMFQLKAHGVEEI